MNKWSHWVELKQYEEASNLLLRDNTYNQSDMKNTEVDNHINKSRF